MTPDSASERFEPRAHRAMASMFDGVSGRYDLLNRLMTLGQDASWRRAMWHEVPERSRVVLDLCTGNGASLPGLRRAGRTVLGVDVSFGMLEAAADEHGGPGWAPRLVCADGFRLPLRDASVNAVTIAFGMRNLRPRREALIEISRVLAPDGALLVLEATGPSPGVFAPLHRFHLKHVVPALGRLSPDPSAYRYLGESILEFGDGGEFEALARESGFEVSSRRRFLMGATALWKFGRQVRPADGDLPQFRLEPVQPARRLAGDLEAARSPGSEIEHESWIWRCLQAALSGALAVALGWAIWVFAKFNEELSLSAAGRVSAWVLLVAGFVAFVVRTVVLALSVRSRPRVR